MTKDDPKPARPPGPRRWVPPAVLGGTLLLTLLASVFVATTTRSRERLQHESEVTSSVRETLDAIETQIQTHVALLRGTAGMLVVDPVVTRDEFRAYVDRLDLPKQYPGILGIGFTRRVPASELDELTSNMRAQAEEYRAFKVWPETPRPEYHAIVYLEPLSRMNRVAIGFDMYTDPVRRAAMEEARDTGRAAASGRVRLVQEQELDRSARQAGFLLFVPVYRGVDIPEQLEERRARLVGFAYSPVRAGDLLNQLSQELKHSATDFVVYDGPAAPENEIFRSAPEAAQTRFGDPPPQTVEVAGRTWTVAFRDRTPQPSSAWIAAALTVAGGGIAISLLLFILTRAEVDARGRAERAAAELRRSEETVREREGRLRRFVDSNAIAVMVGDFQGKIFEANEAFLTLVGYTREDLRAGKLNWHEITPPEYRSLDDQAAATLRQSGRHTPYEKEYIRKDGERVPVLVATAYLGGPEELRVGFIVDLTERRRADEELRRQLHLTRTITTHAAEGIFMLDGEGRTTFVNPAAETMLGWSPDDLLGRVLHEVILPPCAPDDPTTTSSPLPQAILTGWMLRDHEDVFCRKDGTPVPVICSNAPILSPAPQPRVTGAVLVVHDMTERKRAEQERLRLLGAERAARRQAEALREQAEASRSDAEAANRTKDEFLATLSHELRTPLNAILGWAQLLQATSGTDAEELRQGLETIERNARAQSQLVNDLLDLSRIISGKMRLEVSPVDVATVARAAMDSVRLAAEARHIRLEAELPDEPLTIQGDADRLQQVVWNLLSNAIKFTPEGGWVGLALRPVGHETELTITDSGQGIAPDFLPHVFTRLRQADSSSTRRHGGLGLGLSIVRHLVELHGGTVRAASDGVDQGATFSITLPLATVSPNAQPQDAADGNGSHPLQADGASGAAGRLAGLRVMLVEDDPDARALLGRVLRQAGAEVAVAPSVAAAVAALSKTTVDVLVSDIGMPGEDGYGLIRRLRHAEMKRGEASAPDAAPRRMAALAVTAFARPQDRARALEAGFDEHLPKPIQPADLVAAVATLAGAGFSA